MGVGTVVDTLLPLSLVLALSPVPVLTVVLLLLSDGAAHTSTAFLVGWVGGIAGATLVSSLLLESAEAATGTGAVAAWCAIVLGGLFVLLAVRQWWSRPRPGEVPGLPRWVLAVDRFTVRRAGGLGLLLSAVSPKNLPVCVAAGGTIAAGGLSGAQGAWSVIAFTVLAASTVAGPVVAHAALGDRTTRPLVSLRRWLIQRGAAVATTVLLALAVLLIGQGLRGLP
jgi:hypothetical protein